MAKKIYDPEEQKKRMDYENAIKRNQEMLAQKYGIEDKSGPLEPGVVESGKVTQEEFDKVRGNTEKPGLMEGLDFSKASQPSSGGLEGTLGNLLMTSPDPWMKAGGFALATIGQVTADRQKRAMDEMALQQNKAQIAINNARRLGVV